MGLNGLIQSASQIAAGALIASIWQGLLLSAMIWICVKIAPRTTAGVRFLIWMAVFLAAALLPLFSILAAPQAASTPQFAALHGVHAIQLDARWALGIAAFWLVVALAKAVGLVRNAFRVRALWKGSTPVDADAANQSALSQSGFRRAQLCTSSDLDQPCVIGFLAPRVLIPGWLLERATPAELEQIVLHEVSHLRRFDDLTNLFQQLALVCFPLNPALMWIERRLCAEREGACDESVVRATQAPREYATCLTNLAEQRLARNAVALSLGAWEKRSQLATRIESILRGSANLSPLKARAIMTALVLATVGGALKLGSSSQIVSFTSAQEDQPIAQVRQGGVNGGMYHDVVFHPKSASGQPLNSDLVSDYATQPPKKPLTRQPEKKSLRSGSSSADGMQSPVQSQIQSLIIVTRWRSSSGQLTTVTVIDGAVPISALSAAQSPTGWYVVQL